MKRKWEINPNRVPTKQSFYGHCATGSVLTMCLVRMRDREAADFLSRSSPILIRVREAGWMFSVPRRPLLSNLLTKVRVIFSLPDPVDMFVRHHCKKKKKKKKSGRGVNRFNRINIAPELMAKNAASFCSIIHRVFFFRGYLAILQIVLSESARSV